MQPRRLDASSFASSLHCHCQCQPELSTYSTSCWAGRSYGACSRVRYGLDCCRRLTHDWQRWQVVYACVRVCSAQYHRCRLICLKQTKNKHPFNGPFPGLPRWDGTRKVKPIWIFLKQETVIEWQWHQLGHMQVCTSLQTDNHASTPPLSFFTGRMPFLPPNQQCQSTEGDLSKK